ncbi:hypothetical protein [Arthrobacter subterraneus]|uniref:hypothetical protein n=1 Tax=Arthrobacter subterraneus TaxID=335973 RepID=UPI00381E7220
MAMESSMSSEQHEHNVDELEDNDDVQAFDAAMAEKGDNIPWKQALTELGWSNPKS